MLWQSYARIFNDANLLCEKCPYRLQSKIQMPVEAKKCHAFAAIACIMPQMVGTAVVVLRGMAGCAGYFSESMNSRRSAASLKAPL